MLVSAREKNASHDVTVGARYFGGIKLGTGGLVPWTIFFIEATQKNPVV